jgi:hypothetical protein
VPERVVERAGDNVRRIRHVESATERQAREAAEALRAQVLGQIRSAEGQSVAALTAAQQRALLVALLWRAGALTPDLMVRPAGEWAR